MDPDNRRPVDYTQHRHALDAGDHQKLRVTTAALALRREQPDTFLSGAYTPVSAEGAYREHVVAFQRGTDVVAVASRWTTRLAETGWSDTSVELSTGEWTDRLTGRAHAGRVDAADLFAELPVALLVRSHG